MWRCDLDKPCVGYCSSLNNESHLCGMQNKDRNRMEESNRLIIDSKIDNWFDARGITKNGKPMGQAIKTLEETSELLDALNRDDVADVIDAIGDIYVTLRGVCLTYGLPMERCIHSAYNEIKDRTGTLGTDGVFRKDDNE